MPAADSTNGQVSPFVQNLNWQRGTPFPVIQNLKVQSINANYVDVSVQFIGTSINWITFPDYGSNFFFLNDFSGNYTLLLALSNLDLLPNNKYKCIIQFQFSKPEGENKFVEVEINLSLSGAFGIQTDKSLYSLVFNRYNDSLTGDTVVNMLNNTEAKLLSFSQPENVFKPKSGFTDNFTLEDNATLSIANNPAIPNTGSVNYLCQVLGPISEIVSNFEIDLLILDSSGIGFSPANLSFDVIKNTEEKTAILKIINPLNLNFTITTPVWLNASVGGGNSSMDVNFTTVTSGISSGVLNGLIKINFNGEFISVPVSLNLKEFIKIENEDYNFCLDFKRPVFTKIDDKAAYIKVTVKADYLVMSKPIQINKTFTIPYINGSGSFDLGRKLHNYFPRFRNSLFDLEGSAEFMKAINCSLTVEELDVDYQSLSSATVNNLKFLPGNKPKLFPIFSNYQFRKKINSSEFFITHAVENSVLVDSVPNSDTLNQIKYGSQKVDLYELPKVFDPVHLQWENDNLVPEWFTFSGEYSINADFTHNLSQNVLNSLTEKFESKKVKKLQINTGFILKQEIEILEEMIMNRLTFAKIGEKVYQCINVTPKLQLQSSSQSVIERDLEFLIVEQ